MCLNLANCNFPYGPLWYAVNWGYLTNDWNLWLYVIGPFSFFTMYILVKTRHELIALFGYFFIFYLVESNQEYLISSVLWLMLGAVNPVFGLAAILDRLPLFTSWNFSMSGNWMEITHLLRYGVFAVWYIGNIIWWIKRRKELW